MSERLVMLPESYPVARLLCEYVFNEGGEDGAGDTDLLILKKQRNAFEEIINTFPFRTVIELDEKYYGAVTAASTEEFVRKALKAPYKTVFFPVNTFRANAFLFGSVLATEVRAVNSSLYGKKDVVPVVSFALGDGKACIGEVPWGPIMEVVENAKETITGIFRDKAATLKVSGERPNLGLLEGFAHDLEIFCKYALGARFVKGKKVLDIGGGLGYGSFLLSRFAAEVVFVDRSPETVDVVKRLWCEERPNIRPVCGDIGTLGIDDKFDVVFLMDVIEHVEDPEDVLKKVHELIKDDGVVIITTPEEDYYPYSVCPEERWGEAEEKLLDEAIWPWHIQALGEDKLLPLLEKVHFRVREKSYTTYLKGYELKKEIQAALSDPEMLLPALNKLTSWQISDFGVTYERDPYFSAASYNIIVEKDDLR